MVEQKRKIRKSLDQRFHEKYEIDAKGCWIWTAQKVFKGPSVSPRLVGKPDYPNETLAHRISYILYKNNGENIPEGKMVLHTCEHGECVNPDHLFLGEKPIMRNKRTVSPRPYKTSGIRGIQTQEQTLAQHLRSKYKLEYDEYLEMIQNQKGVCAICGKPPSGKERRLDVDHCHETERIRKLLCRRCNKILGFANDNIHIIRSAIEYLSEN